MTDCIFCAIVSGKIPAVKVYEDSNLLAFMDIKPINPGHVLVIPKKHATSLSDVDEKSAAAMLTTARRIANAIKKADPSYTATNYVLSDGADAGQEVPHAHLHIVPRRKNDGFGFRMPSAYGAPVSKDDLGRIATSIIRNLI